MTRFASTPFVISASRTLTLLVLLINPPSLFFYSMSMIDCIADAVNFTAVDNTFELKPRWLIPQDSWG